MPADKPIADYELEGLFGWLRTYFPLTLAVSGGPDSLAMMRLIARWMTLAQAGDDSAGAASGASAAARDVGKRLAQQVMRQIAIVTLDHGLRPESADEAAFVKREAEALGFFHETLVWRDEKPVTGLQAAARDARYRLMGAFHRRYWQDATISQNSVAQYPASPPATALDVTSAARALTAAAHQPGLTGGLVTAHHQDDQAETLLMRLGRGSGIDGLAGMTAISMINCSAPVPELAGGVPEAPAALKILRPLLGLPKARLIASLVADNVRFVEDPSNQDSDFERVRLRAARPALQAVGLRNDMLALSATRAARARDALEVATIEMAQRARLQIHDLGYGALDHAVFLRACEELRIRLLGRLLGFIGGADGNAERAQGLRLSKLEDLAARLAATPDAGQFSGATLAGCLLRVKDGRILVFRETGRPGLPDVRIEPGEARHWDGRFQVSVDRHFGRPLCVSPLGERGWAQLKADYPSLADHAISARAAIALPVFRSIAAPRHGPASEPRDPILAVPSLAAFEPKLAGPMRAGQPLLQASVRRPQALT